MECFIEENCKRKINKACKKNPPLKGVVCEEGQVVGYV